MKKEKAHRILKMLDRINDEIDLLNKSIFREKFKPAPVSVRKNADFRIK